MVPMLVSITTTGLAARAPPAATTPSTTKQRAITLTDSMSELLGCGRRAQRAGELYGEGTLLRSAAEQRYKRLATLRRSVRRSSVQRGPGDPGGFHLAAQVGEVGGQLLGRLDRAAGAGASGTAAGAAGRAPAGLGAAAGLATAGGGVAGGRGAGEVQQPDGEAEASGQFVQERRDVAGIPRQGVQ